MSTSPDTAERTEAPALTADQMRRFAKICRGNADRRLAEAEGGMARLLDLAQTVVTADREKKRLLAEAETWEARAAEVSA